VSNRALSDAQHVSKDKAVLQSFPPIASLDASRLILGSMPGQASLDANQYYAHARNSFWPIMQILFGGSIKSYEDRLALADENQIAIWDTLKYCARKGSLDSKIEKDTVVANDFTTLLTRHEQIKTIAFNGKAAETWFKKLVVLELPEDRELHFVSLPSSSPAMATLNPEQKAEQWRAALLNNSQTNTT